MNSMNPLNLLDEDALSRQLVEKFNKMEHAMATVNFSVPDDIKAAFNEAFANRNKSAVIADLMREAVERERRRERSNEAIARLLARWSFAPKASDDELRTAREAGRP